MRNVLTLLKSTSVFLGLDQKRCAACFTPYSPATDLSFADLYEQQMHKEGLPGCALSGWNHPPQLCPDCLEELAPRTKGYCPVCGMLYSKEAGEPSRCSRCMVAPPPWTHITMYGAYEGLLRELLLQHKFHNRLDTGLTVARLLAAVYKPKDVRPVAVVPMPLHSERLKNRGHNQTLLPAKLLGQKLGIQVLPHVLRRVRATAPQASLDKKDRKKNVEHAFEATLPNVLQGAHVLLVDDIATTCTTLEQGAATLLKEGAGSVEVAIIARTPEPSDRKD